VVPFLRFNRLMLVVKPSDSQAAELTPESDADHFGLSQADIAGRTE